MCVVQTDFHQENSENQISQENSNNVNYSQGPGTPLEPHPDDIAAMAAEEAQRNAALRIPISEGELSGDDSDSTVPPTTTTSGKPIHKKRK
ncbi:hypothetical protein B9Z55_024265 [Caenorhabditis nigoni]|nr:hypothetical protein B9Z55_024265 [Caenorhabditis nigoni]